MNKKPFLTDVKTLRERARDHIRQGAVTPGYGAERDAVIRVLNDVLATELVCVLRYKRHQFTAKGIHAKSVADEFAQHASEEQSHADMVAERINQLGGAPDFNPSGLASRSHSEYAEGEDLVDMIEEDLVAERIAVDSYREIARFLGDGDPTSRRMIEAILEKEEEHAEDMASLLQVIRPKEPAADGPGRARHARRVTP